jgi:hypothetical protein
MEILNTVKHTIKPLAKWAAVVTTLAAFGGIAWFLYSNVYRPTIKVISVDYDKSIAIVQVNGGIPLSVYAGSIRSAGGAGWGVQFASDDSYDTTAGYNRLELVKNGLTFKTLDIKTVT